MRSADVRQPSGAAGLSRRTATTAHPAAATVRGGSALNARIGRSRCRARSWGAAALPCGASAPTGAGRRTTAALHRAATSIVEGPAGDACVSARSRRAATMPRGCTASAGLREDAGAAEQRSATPIIHLATRRIELDTRARGAAAPAGCACPAGLRREALAALKLVPATIPGQSAGQPLLFAAGRRAAAAVANATSSAGLGCRTGTAVDEGAAAVGEDPAVRPGARAADGFAVEDTLVSG